MAHHKIKLAVTIALLLGMSCRHNPPDPLAGGNYPSDVSNIILNKCAISGCHNQASYTGAANLNLTTWANMFNGAGLGSVVIPYRPDFSPLCFFTNTYPDLGINLEPTMPIGQSPLTKTEYSTLHNWIAAGAPSATGEIKFAENLSRKKIYVTNRLCDVVTILDAESLLQMRYVDVGNKPIQEFPYCIKVSRDKKHWYVSFFARSNIVQKFSAQDDKLIGEFNLGPGMWTSFEITSDSKYGYFVDNSNPGRIVYADLEKMSALATYTFNGNFRYPSGIALNEKLKKLYIGTISGNYIYNVDITDPLTPYIEELVIDKSSAIQYESSLDPTELLADPENNDCYIACLKSKEIRVVSMQTGKLLSTIPLNAGPAFMALSPATQKLLVSCPDDYSSFPGNRGSVVIVDIQSNSLYKKINSGYQPYGIAVIEENKMAVVVNANISSNGPGSHHVSGCGKKNGNLTFIDLNTFDLIPNTKREVAVYPFGVAVR